MIEKINDYDFASMDKTQKPWALKEKQDEIIDILNEDECAQECRTELPSLEDCKNIEQQDWQPNEMQNSLVENINVDDMHIAEKKVDKLEEAREFQVDSYCILNAKNMFNNKSIVVLKEQMDIKIQLLEQAIEQIIKEKDEEIKKWIEDRDNWFDRFDKLNRDQLKQKKPDEECINFLKDLLRPEIICSDYHREIAKKLLKYFGEL